MRDELEKQLIEKYPTIFQNVGLPPTESCMSWGMECGDGWYGVIDRLCNSLVSLNNTVVADQVKEKFGGLRFYAHFMSDEVERKNDQMWELIDQAELESFSICEMCGMTGRLSTNGHWLKTLCKKHRSEKDYKIYEGKSI
jgi:hypothetical protein